jgi:hypothetical protein
MSESDDDAGYGEAAEYIHADPELVEEGIDTVQQWAGDAWDTAQEGAEQAGEWVTDTAEQAGDWAQETWEDAKEFLEENPDAPLM